MMVDILGNLFTVKVHAAKTPETIAAELVLKNAAHIDPTIKAFSGDWGYRGTAETLVSEALKGVLHIAEKPVIEPGQFKGIPQRWIRQPLRHLFNATA